MLMITDDLEHQGGFKLLKDSTPMNFYHALIRKLVEVTGAIAF